MSETELTTTNQIPEQTPPMAAYEPKIVCFACQYCSYTAADMAGSMRLHYAPNVRIIKVLCSGKVDAILLLQAFEKGADAVYVAACEPGDCHFLEGNLRALKRVEYTRQLLKEVGLEPERLEMFHIAASNAPGFAKAADEMTARALKLGPSPLKNK